MVTTSLETLLCDLGLGGSDRPGGVGVNEAAAQLAVLFARGLGGADAEPESADLGAASARAVSVVNAAAGDELLALAHAGTDILGVGVIGGESEGDGGD